MSCCCTEGARAPTPALPPDSETAGLGSSSKPVSWSRRLVGFFKWALPIVTLTLMPKCPACLASYALILTGVGLSGWLASTLRWGVIALCVGALAYLVIRAVGRALRPTI